MRAPALRIRAGTRPQDGQRCRRQRAGARALNFHLKFRMSTKQNIQYFRETIVYMQKKVYNHSIIENNENEP